MSGPRRRFAALALGVGLVVPGAAWAFADPLSPLILEEMVRQGLALEQSIETAQNIKRSVTETAEVAKRSWSAMQQTAGFVAHPERFLQESAEAWVSMFPDLHDIGDMLREQAIVEGREAFGAAMRSPTVRSWQEQFVAAASRGETELQRGLGYVVDALDWADPHARAIKLLQSLREQAQTAMHDVSEQFRSHSLDPEQASYVATRAAVTQAALQSHVADVVTHLAQQVDVAFGNAMAATSESLEVQQKVHEQLRDASSAWRARPFFTGAPAAGGR